MLDPLIYASADLSVYDFEYSYATQGLNQPIKYDMCLIEAALYYLFLTKYEFLLPSNAWKLVLDSLNYAFVDLSIDDFEYG